MRRLVVFIAAACVPSRCTDPIEIPWSSHENRVTIDFSSTSSPDHTQSASPSLPVLERLPLAIQAISRTRSESESFPSKTAIGIWSSRLSAKLASEFSMLRDDFQDTPALVDCINAVELAISRELELPKSPRSIGNVPVLRIVTELDHLLEAFNNAYRGLHTTELPDLDLDDPPSRTPANDESLEQQMMFAWDSGV